MKWMVQNTDIKFNESNVSLEMWTVMLDRGDLVYGVNYIVVYIKFFHSNSGVLLRQGLGY